MVLAKHGRLLMWKSLLLHGKKKKIYGIYRGGGNLY